MVVERNNGRLASLDQADKLVPWPRPILCPLSRVSPHHATCRRVPYAYFQSVGICCTAKDAHAEIPTQGTIIQSGWQLKRVGLISFAKQIDALA
jgi:hypothetical protein